MDQNDLQPQTEFPGPDCRLPSDLDSTAGLGSKPGLHLQALSQTALSSLKAAEAGQFGRQAQSVSLLDQLFSITRLPTSAKETKLAELGKLDSKVRSFLEVMMSDGEWRQTPICAPVALCFR